MKKNTVLIKVFTSIFLGALVGLWTGTEASVLGIPWIKIFNLISQLFLNALTIVVVPLVVSSIITGTARVGADQSFGKLGSRTFFYFILTSLIAVSVGLVLTLVIAPGSSVDRTLLQGVAASELKNSAQGGLFVNFEQILFQMIPSNIISVAAEGQLMGVIFFSLLFGYFVPRLDSPYSDTLREFWNGVFQVMMKMTHLVMRALPLGVFALMAKVTATTGLAAIKPISLFFITVILGLGIHMFVLLPLLLKFMGKVNPIKHFQDVFPAVVTAFSTSSTAATLPITLDCMEKRAGLPNSLCSFILPLGTSLNLAGTALYVTSSTIFIGQAYNLVFDITMLFPILLMGLFTALGMVPAIPSGSIITIVVVLQSIGLPADGIILVLAVERILDMCRTSVSVFNNTCCAVLVGAK